MIQLLSIVGGFALLVAACVAAVVGIKWVKSRLPKDEQLSRTERLLIGLYLREKLENEESDVAEELAAYCDVPVEVINQIEGVSLTRLNSFLKSKRQSTKETSQ
jgi:hypothetical protein